MASQKTLSPSPRRLHDGLSSWQGSSISFSMDLLSWSDPRTTLVCGKRPNEKRNTTHWTTHHQLSL
jgi:hypothetical protein